MQEKNLTTVLFEFLEMQKGDTTAYGEEQITNANCSHIVVDTVLLYRVTFNGILSFARS